MVTLFTKCIHYSTTTAQVHTSTCIIYILSSTKCIHTSFFQNFKVHSTHIMVEKFKNCHGKYYKGIFLLNKKDP